MKNFITLLLVFLYVSIYGQDKIFKKSGDIINCKVTELATAEVKYYYAENPKLIFGIDNAKLEKIVFGTGEEILIKSNSFLDEDYYAKQSKHAFKFNFLSPLLGSSEFTYEQNIKPGRSWETSIGIIGLGFDPGDNDPRGVFGKFAYKFIRSPDYYTSRMHYSHIMKGAYFAPELALRYVTYDGYSYDYYNGYSDEERKTDFAVALTLKFGKQWVFDNGLLIDVFCGIGYGINREDGGDGPLVYGFLAGSSEMPVAITSGIRIGWVF